MSKYTRPGVLLYFSEWHTVTRQLNMEQRGELVSALMQFAETGEVPDIKDLRTQILFDLLEEKTQKDAERYRESCIARAYSAYKGLCSRYGRIPASKEKWLATVAKDSNCNEFEEELRTKELNRENECELEEGVGETTTFEDKRREALAKAAAAWK